MISREHAKEVLENLVNNEVLKSVLLRTDIEAMKCAISVLSEPKKEKGYWIEDKCSCCGKASYPYDLSGYGNMYHNFCPNCGADLREEN